ncbi:MAG TPA: UDP-3-O-(3-hydroxymyristoyl)glucosamine N-acyltransferase [Thermodesulfovibrionales bacterium]|nr:UDP-3-O-(3-hydroxymyristoyl)glucosamine N-acyltransferase [Thermodesulfovibrionales bacterium]
MRVRELAEVINGEIIGDGNIEIRGVAGILEAGEGDITFLSARKYIKDLPRCRASCLIVKDFVPDTGMTQLKVANPYLAYAKLLEYIYKKPRKAAVISGGATISDTAIIAGDVSIYPFAYISDRVSVGKGTIIHPFVYVGEDTSIGEDCIIYPNVTLREGLKLGDRVIVHSGSVVGSDGFGYVFDAGLHHKIPQVGGVIIEDDVEIGSNVSIDRATTGNTVIGRGSKIDNLTQIAHNVKIGSNSIIVAQVGIAGSSEVGDYVTLGGQVGVADHTRIDPETMIGAQSGVMGHVAKGIYSGSPAIPHREWLKAQAVFAKLPELQKKIRELEEQLLKLHRRDA